MTTNPQVRQQKLLTAAEGYYELEMYDHALAALNDIPEPGTVGPALHRLRGEVLRALEQHQAALEVFELARAETPDDVQLLMAMAWCWKRTNQLPRAIAAMEHAYRISPNVAVVLYNLACYWSLAGNKTQALSWLGRALRMDSGLRQLIPTEHDFDPLRHDPDFQLIIHAKDDVR